MKIQKQRTKTAFGVFAPASKKMAVTLAASAMAFLGLNASAKAANWYDFSTSNPLGVGVSVLNPGVADTASDFGSSDNWTFVGSTIDYKNGSKKLDSSLEGLTVGLQTSLSGNVSIQGSQVKPGDKSTVTAKLTAPAAELPFYITYDYQTSTTKGKSGSFFEIRWYDVSAFSSNLLYFYDGSLAATGSYSVSGGFLAPALDAGDYITFTTYVELHPSLTTGIHQLNANAQMNIAIPEPSSYAAALGLAALGLVGMKRVRDRHQQQALQA